MTIKLKNVKENVKLTLEAIIKKCKELNIRKLAMSKANLVSVNYSLCPAKSVVREF